MSDKEEIGSAGLENGDPSSHGVGNVRIADKEMADIPHEEDWKTRTGLNLKSFQRRDYGTGIVELDRSMKGRHLHMIAIGSLPSSLPLP
jgi:yeast amino acid transporter